MAWQRGHVEVGRFSTSWSSTHVGRPLPLRFRRHKEGRMGGRIYSTQAIYERKWKTWQGRRLREINIACLNIALLHQDLLGLLAQCSNLYGKYSRVREKSVVNDMWADQPNALCA